MRRLGFAAILLTASLFALVSDEVAHGQEDVGPVYAQVEFLIDNQRAIPKRVVVEYEVDGKVLATKELNLAPGKYGRIEFKATAWWLSFTTHTFAMRVYDGNGSSVACGRLFNLVNIFHVVQQIEKWNTFGLRSYDPCELSMLYDATDRAVAEILL